MIVDTSYKRLLWLKLAKIMTQNGFQTKKVITHQQNTMANIKIFVKAGNPTRDLSHRSLLRYL